MSLGGYEKMESVYIGELAKKRPFRISLEELDGGFEPGKNSEERNRELLKESGVTGMFLHIKSRSVFLLGCYSAVIEESPNCKYMSLKWGYRQLPGQNESLRKSIIAKVEGDKVLIGYQTPEQIRYKKVNSKNLPILVGKALAKAVEM